MRTTTLTLVAVAVLLFMTACGQAASQPSSSTPIPSQGATVPRLPGTPTASPGSNLLLDISSDQHADEVNVESSPFTTTGPWHLEYTVSSKPNPDPQFNGIIEVILGNADTGQGAGVIASPDVAVGETETKAVPRYERGHYFLHILVNGYVASWQVKVLKG